MKSSNPSSKRSSKGYYLLVAIGVAGIIFGLVSGSERFWPGVLHNALFYLTIALGTLALVAIQHLTNAGWSVAIRRVPEAMTSYLPLGAILLLTVFFGRHSLYEWSEHAIPATGPMSFKSAWLGTGFFFARMTAILALWSLFAWLIRRESVRQDVDGSVEHTYRSRRYSGIFMVVLAITITVSSFDWTMSIEPEFYSTLYGWYCFSGAFLAGIAATLLGVVLLRRRGLLRQTGQSHLHSLGKLLFAFSTFWAYLWICQYLLIYYTNLPEETSFYIARQQMPEWNALFIGSLLLNWLAPFIILIRRKAKLDDRWLIIGSLLVLAGHWVDLYLSIAPPLHIGVMPGIVDLALVCGFTGVFLLAFRRSFAEAAEMPKHDPYLGESLQTASHDVPARRAA
jgi:hypothetical protein